jgi:hypothetical protein
MSDDSILWFDALSKTSTPLAGGKGANLGELTRAGFPVPPGFVITASAFLAALDAAGIRGQLAELFAGADADNPAALAATAARMQALVTAMALPDGLRAAVAEAYARLGARDPVAVRSSAWYARMLRGSMLEIFTAEYVRTAHAKGLRRRTVLFAHVLRNALGPLITIWGMDFGFFFSGLVGRLNYSVDHTYRNQEREHHNHFFSLADR